MAPPLERPRAALLIVFGLAACSPTEADEVRFLRLEQFRPRPEARVGVFLNEPLVLHFSAPVDPSSITAESLSVRAEDSGRRAEGRFEVDGRRVTFAPKLGKARDLSDGGLRPGTRYEVLVRGFPAPDGVRSLEGWPLARSARFLVETAALTQPRGQMFEDRTPATGEPLRLEQRPYGGAESLRLSCAEALDPSTLVDGEFVLRALDDPEQAIPLDPSLESNASTSGAVLELRPRRLLGPGVYTLSAPRGASVRDFGGNPVWLTGVPGAEQQLRVLEPGEESLAGRTVTFLSDAMRSSLVLEEADGTAAWGSSGVISVRFPRAAGDGHDGRVLLDQAEPRADVHAVRLGLAAGRECQLLSEPGLVVLRSQGGMRIEGALRRRSGASEVVIDGSFGPGETLSRWLERFVEEDPNWTVMVAGGDLVIEGELDVEGPLLLVAGGRIRVTGRVRAQEDELWLLGEGGGGGLDPTKSAAPLVLDPPVVNPLVESLTYAVLSLHLPPEGGVARWLGAEVRAEARSGSYRVLYLPSDPPIGRPLEEWGAAESPKDLLEADRLRLLLLLTVDPPLRVTGEAWNPPVIDEVRLSWEPAPR